MKSIAQFVVVAALACGAQAAWSDESNQASEQRAESAEAYLNVAQIAGAEGHQMGAEAKSVRKSRNMLEELGLAAEGPFPSRGGPIDE